MARWAAAIPTWTTGSGTADATAITDGSHHSISSGSSTQRGEIREIYLGGQATASAPMLFVFGRNTTVSTTLTGTRLAALDPSTANLTSMPTAFGTAGTSKPSRHTTSGCLLNLSFNGFGGIVRWYAGPDEVIGYYGTAAGSNELTLSCFTGSTSGLVGTNIVFEVV